VPCERHLRVLVRDTGIGLSPQDITKLFVPFERLGAARSQIEGTGIGLTLCKRLVRAMNGDIGIESEVGQGSTFWIDIPLVSMPPEQTTVLALDDMAASAKATLENVATILYIEDNLSNIRLIERALSARKYQVKLLTAMQGSVGLDLAAQHTPDLILLDLNLPDITGDVVLRHLKMGVATRDLTVVVISADATPSQVARLMEIGAQAYLTKPLDLKQFYDVVEQMISKKA
jgi:CheY-like chemotaxis protein